VQYELEFEDDLIEEAEPETKITEEPAFEVVVGGSDWTAETVISQMSRSNISVTPRFQRRDVWNLSKKSRFIESLIAGIPIPPLVLAEDKERRGKYIVLDGKQRLLTLMQFYGIAKEGANKFTLRDLSIISRLEGKNISDLREPELSEYGDALDNAIVRTVVIKNWPDSDYLHIVFIRLNSNSVALSPQELRQALVPGEFTDLLDEASAGSKLLQQILGREEPDFRMRDCELLLRYLAFAFSSESYRGDLKKFLDEFSKDMNDNWEVYGDRVKAQIQVFEYALSVGFEIFGDNFGKRWLGGQFETRRNRAILDVLLYTFSHPNIEQLNLAGKEAVLAAFKETSTNRKFKNATEQTTKSIGAFKDRYSIWIDVLNRHTSIDIEVPGFGTAT